MCGGGGGSGSAWFRFLSLVLIKNVTASGGGGGGGVLRPQTQLYSYIVTLSDFNLSNLTTKTKII